MAGTSDQRRREALAALAGGRRQAEIAAEFGVSTKTIGRWAAVAATEDPVERALAAALEATLPDGTENWDVRLRAARILRLPAPMARKAETPATVTLLIRREGDTLTVTREDTGETLTHDYLPGEPDRTAA